MNPASSFRSLGGLVLGLSAALALPACQTSRPAQETASGRVDSVPAPRVEPPTARATRVLPGVEVLLRDSLALLRGKRVGFITNQSAVSSRGESAIDLLARAPGVQLVALFSPEHGIRGTAEGGAQVNNARDEKTGLPIFSLYGKTQKPTDEMLRGLDVLVFDIQDIGARPYTFVWTMAMALEAAAAKGIPFVVLDRPNPITDAVDGGLMQEELKRDRVGQPITGYYPVPLRHGMTTGEIARYINGEYNLGANLHVIPAEGWRSNQWFDQTRLPWVNPSPNIRSLDAALKYSGLVLTEATNLTVGRGTDAPFSYVGAPWMNAPEVLRRVRAYDLPGVRFDTVRFVPTSADPKAYVPYRGKPVRALRLTVTDRNAFRPAYTTLVLLTEVRRANPAEFKIEDLPGFTQMMGSRWAVTEFQRGTDPREIDRRWREENARWMTVRDKYRLYPRG